MVSFIWQLASFLFGLITVVFLLTVSIMFTVSFIEVLIEKIIKALKNSR